MLLNLPTLSGDDPAMTTAVAGLIARTVEETRPEDVYLVRIDRWFDHKWLRFSGRAVVPYPVRAAPGLAT